jgi:anti-sigma regulatory factor (Ser/Thr protein kinase)
LLFRLEIPTPLPQRLKGDAGKLRQVLFNLLDNAIKYTPSGRVSLRVETKEAQSGGYRLAFSVRDEGQGIPPARQAVIFDAFVRFGEHQDSLPGTGLGLTISRDYVRLLGGELSLHSAPGQGACFSFTIPLQAAAPLDGAERAPAPAEIPPHAPAALPPPLLLDRLPASLRAQLRQALLDLDAAHLADLREIIWAEDPGLGETLKTYLDNYDYAPLLAALE